LLLLTIAIACASDSFTCNARAASSEASFAELFALAASFSSASLASFASFSSISASSPVALSIAPVFASTLTSDFVPSAAVTVS
jgi:hypothetical protein